MGCKTLLESSGGESWPCTSFEVYGHQFHALEKKKPTNRSSYNVPQKTGQIKFGFTVNSWTCCSCQCLARMEFEEIRCVVQPMESIKGSGSLPVPREKGCKRDDNPLNTKDEAGALQLWGCSRAGAHNIIN